MKLYAPLYYKEFACIADRCSHSCCIGWEIDVDDAAMKKYEGCRESYGETIRESIENGDVPHFRLTAGERCPHLDERGLCRIISTLGDEYLCEICREHPRFYHETPSGREVGLGLSCEEACRLILSSDAYDEFIEVGNCEGETDGWEFDPTQERAEVYRILRDTALPYGKRLAKIACEYDVSLSAYTDGEWRERLSALEYLIDTHKTLFASFTKVASVSADAEAPLLRAFAYFVFRHASGAETPEEFRAAVGFALLCERLLASMVNRGVEIHEAARILSEEIEYTEENAEALLFEFF